MRKIMIALCMFVVLLTGCSTGNSSYSRSTDPGELRQLTLEETYAKLENKENFNLLITMSFCSHCHALKEVLEPYLEHHGVVIYELILDKEAPTNAEYNKAKAELNKYLTDYEGTPSFYYIENGMKKDEIIGFGGEGSDTIDIDTYDAFIQKYQLDKE